MKKTKQDLKPASGRSDGAGTDRVRRIGMQVLQQMKPEAQR